MTRPTLAQHAWAQNDTFRRYGSRGHASSYAELQALRDDFSAGFEVVSEPDAELIDLPAPPYSEDRVLVYFIVAVIAVFAIKHFWGIA